MNRLTIFRAMAAILLVASAVASLFFLPVRERAGDLLEWLTTLGTWGPIVWGAVYIPAAVFCVPGLLLTIGGGFAFGIVPGTIAASLGSTLGATAAFLVSRTVGRDWIAQRIAGNPRFAALDRAVAESGFKIVFLTRLSPVLPYNLLNYTFGLTRVRLRDYVFASWIGMLPGTITYIYIGRGLKDLADLFAGRVERTTGQTALFVVGLVATVLVTILLTRVARRALQEALPEP